MMKFYFQLPGFLILFLLNISSIKAQTILYVSEGAAGTGSSWADASGDLSSILNGADPNTQVWVSSGNYKPTAYPDGCIGCATDRDYAFILKEGVSLYGGFAGTETDLEQRILIAGSTVLDGDIGTAGDNIDNVFHVIVAADVTASLDGFTITGAYADEESSIYLNGFEIDRNVGGGIHIYRGNYVLENNIFTVNFAINGAGLFFFLSNNTLINIHISQNTAFNAAGCFSVNSDNILRDNIFSDNVANFLGGGMRSISSTNTLTNNVFLGNSASVGGGFHSILTTNSLINNTFSGNFANIGGALNVGGSTNTIINTIIWGNSSGIFNSGGDTEISNSILQEACPGFVICNDVLITDPLFISPPLIGPGHSGDLRLQICSPAIDAANDVPAPEFDRDGNTRVDAIAGASIADMGAYEYQSEWPIWYADMDADGYGNPSNSIQACEMPSNYTSDNTDCNDSDLDINPGADEICDGLDNDCNGNIDDAPECEDECLNGEDSDCDSISDICDICPGGDDSIDNNNDGLPDCKYPPSFNEIIAEWKCGNNKVYVCKVPPGNHGNGQTICAGYNSLKAHLKKGSYLGPCGNANCEEIESSQNFNTSKIITLNVNDHVTIYPNPTSGEVFLDLHVYSGSDLGLQLYSIQGNLLRNIEISAVKNLTEKMDFSGFAEGIYVIRIYAAGHEDVIQRLVLVNQGR